MTRTAAKNLKARNVAEAKRLLAEADRLAATGNNDDLMNSFTYRKDGEAMLACWGNTRTN